MLITFSSPALASVSRAIGAVTRTAPNVYGSVNWKSDTQCRFKLLAGDQASRIGEGLPASSQAHDTFIRAILRQDPRATIRTSRAIYRGAADYEKQTGEKLSTG